MAKILLVEDDNSLREIYEARLLAEGYEIVAAQDGEEALAVAVKEKPDLIISDVMMPKISGFDMLDILRSTPETKDCKIIMMTALSQVEDKERADKLGADRYLVKSQVTLEDVAKVAKEVLEGTPATSEPAVLDMPAAASTASAPSVNDSTAAATDTNAANPVASEPATQPVVVAEPATETPAATPTVAVEPVVASSDTPVADSTTTTASPDTTNGITSVAPAATPTQTTDNPTAASGETASPFLVSTPSSEAPNITATPPADVDESSKIAANIESFLSVKSTAEASPVAETTTPTPEENTPNEPTATPEVSAAPPVEPVIPTPEPAITPSENTETAEADTKSPTTTRPKVIQPLNSTTAAPVDLNALAQKQEELDAARQAALNPATPQAQQTPAQPSTQIDPDSLAL